jgi:ethanolamine utilization protein
VDNEKLVQLVTLEVMRQLKQKPAAIQEDVALAENKALAIFTGGTIGFEQGLAEIKKIQNLNFSVTVVLSAAAEQIIGIDRIKAELGSYTTIVTAHSPYPGDVLREAELVLVPVLTQNTAAKLAHTLSDTMVSTLILQGLMMGKPVVAALNAADPMDSWRIQANMGKASPGLLKALRANLQQLEGYGIQLVQVTALAEESQKLLGRKSKKSAASLANKKSVLDAVAIKNTAANGVKSIAISRGTIITPLAKDVAREYGVEIILEQ